MNTMMKILLGSTAAYLLFKEKKGFHNITALEQIRGCDTQGCGHYGASRDGGTRFHDGIDFIVQEGEPIYSPITGKVFRDSYPYGNDLRWKGTFIGNDKYGIKLWYMTPIVAAGDTIVEGQIIGYAQDISIKYNGITPHVHMQVMDLQNDSASVDPTLLV